MNKTVFDVKSETVFSTKMNIVIMDTVFFLYFSGFGTMLC